MPGRKRIFACGRALRIKREREIRDLLRNGDRWRCPLFTVIWATTTRGCSRCAVIVSRATGSAARRNRIKRIVREQFRILAAHHPPTRDLLVRIHPKPVDGFTTRAVAEAFTQWLATPPGSLPRSSAAASP